MKKKILAGIGSLLLLFSLYKGTTYVKEKINFDNNTTKIEDEYVDIDSRNVLQIDFNSLEKINPDVYGWIHNENTDINYPIVQGSDNEYYLKHAMDKSNSSHGSLFIDYRNSDNYQDDVTMIYGHNMKDETMFGTLDNYRNKNYYTKHDDIYVYDDQYIYQLKVFAASLLDGNYVFVGNYKDQQQFNNNMKYILDNSTINTDVKVNYGDKVVGLYTCAYDFTDAKYIVYGVMQGKMKTLK